MPDYEQPDLFAKRDAYARRSDPETSHAAAETVKVGKVEGIVYDAFVDYGQMNPEDCTNITGLHIDTITPRFAPLRRKGLLRKVLNPDGSVKKTRGASGSMREVHEAVLGDVNYVSEKERTGAMPKV